MKRLALTFTVLAGLTGAAVAGDYSDDPDKLMSAVAAARYKPDCESRGVWLPANFEKYKTALVNLLPTMPVEARAAANRRIDEMRAENQKNYCDTLHTKITHFGAAEIAK